MMKYKCRFNGCSNLLEVPGYCEKHEKYKPIKKSNSIPFKNATRPNKELYNSSDWKKIRREMIEKTPFCFQCRKNENLQVHHMIPPKGNPELFFDIHNLVVVCADCHKKITAEEIRNEKRSKASFLV